MRGIRQARTIAMEWLLRQKHGEITIETANGAMFTSTIMTAVGDRGHIASVQAETADKTLILLSKKLLPGPLPKVTSTLE